MSNYRKALGALLALGGFGIVAIASDARASDRHTYHASACQATDGINANYNRSPYRITKTGGSGIGHLLCPVLHDAFSEKYDDLLIRINSLEVEVSVQDWHSQNDITCALSVRATNGGAYWWHSDKTTGMEFATLKLGPGWVDRSEPHAYLLECDVPTNDANGYAKIFNYTALERKD